MKYKNYKDEVITLSVGTWEHILESHPEITIKIIKNTLFNPNEVRQSTHKKNSELYYLLKSKNRYYCVIVKICPEGNFISTALIADKIKKGKLIYKAGGK